MPNWTAEQLAVIRASGSSRTLVNAGPGTGKTAVACGRIAHLVNDAGIAPVNIWLVSFTRTAVHELRNRIAGYLSDPREASAIKIATIDSHAWAIQSGFNSEASLTGSFEDNIEKVISLVQTKEGVFEYLSGVSHLFIDEAQDVIGERCLLMLEIIHALSPGTGVTVLADEAQSIYGFTEDAEVEGHVKETLPDAIRKYFDDFAEKQLTEIHRTADQQLCRIFRDGREIVSGKCNGLESLRSIREVVTDSCHGTVRNFREDIAGTERFPDNCFLLFRRRGEALEASSCFQSRMHRIRMSGLPAVIDPWLAGIFWDWTDSRMEETEFLKRWSERLPDRNSEADGKWRILVRLFGETQYRVSLEKMAGRLGGGSPPIELCTTDFGDGGPVVGTIHGVKGREADEVRLYLPRMQDDPCAESVMTGEEARIVFVGATRACSMLKVGKGATRTICRRIEPTGRTFTDRSYHTAGAASVEIGRQGDIDPAGIAGTEYFDREHVEWAQEEIQKLGGKVITEVVARLAPGMNFRYGVHLEENLDPVCFLSPQVNKDMFTIAKFVDKKKPPFDIKHLRTFGVRSLVLKPDDPVRDILHPPWSKSGFMFAPLIIGYSVVYFK